MKDFKNIPEISVQEVENQIAEILKKEFPFDGKTLNRNILNVIDLTTLEGADTTEKVHQLCQKALQYKTAAVCVYPPFAAQVKKELSGSGIQTACVSGAFPSGQSPIEIKLAEVAYTVGQGADEIDMVISRGAFLEGKYDQVFDEIKQIKTACKNAHLKVILETGELQTLKNIQIASEISIEAGADFIKTSTGKIPVAATLEAAFVMINVIKKQYENTGKKIGFKPAGGISDPETAAKYYALVYHILGEEWCKPQLFRIGASRLADKIWDKL